MSTAATPQPDRTPPAASAPAPAASAHPGATGPTGATTTTETLEPTGGRRAAPTPALTERARRPIPFGRLVAVEVRKLVDTRGALAFHLVIALLIVGFGLLTLAIDQNPPFTTVMGLAQFPLMLLVPVVGVLVGAGEWNHRSAMVTFTLEPRRLRVLAAKLVAVLVAFVSHLLVVGAVAAAVTGLTGGAWDGTFGRIAGQSLVLLAQTLGGFAIGLVFPVAALGIVLYFVVYFVLQLMVPAIELWAPAAKVVPWVATSLAWEPLAEGFDLSSTEWQRAGLAFGLWVVLLGALGTWLSLRREAK